VLRVFDDVYLSIAVLMQLRPEYKDWGIQGEAKPLRLKGGGREEGIGGPPRGRY